MNIKSLVKLEFKRYKSNKILLFSMILLPLIICLGSTFAIYYLNNSDMEDVSIAIVNNDKGEDMDMFLSLLKNTESIKENAKIEVLEYDLAIEQLKDNDIDMVVLFPESFTKKIYNGKKTYIEIIENNRSVNKVKSIIMKKIAIDGISLGVYAQKSLDIVWDTMKDNGYTKEEIREAYNSNAMSILYNIAGRNKMFVINEQATHIIYYLVLVFIIFIFINALIVFVTLNSVQEENILMRFKINNIKYIEYIASKFLVSILLQITLYGIPLFILMACLKVLTFAVVLSVILVSLCSNLLIFLLTAILKNNIVSTMVYCILISFWVLTRNVLILNPIGKSLYMLIDVFNGKGLSNIYSLVMFIILLIVLCCGVYIKNYFTKNIKGLDSCENM